jgi:hypothetical protein
MGHGKYHMIIFHRKQLLFAILNPELFVNSLAPWAMTIPAAVQYIVHAAAI